MHREQIELWQHEHVFNIEKKSVEKRTLIVVVIAFITMIAEIFFGWLTNSMALLADGWHMGTHAFGLTRQRATDRGVLRQLRINIG